MLLKETIVAVWNGLSVRFDGLMYVFAGEACEWKKSFWLLSKGVVEDEDEDDEMLQCASNINVFIPSSKIVVHLSLRFHRLSMVV
jgi:hypothetical protein